jgi:site-specific recombinase XerD
MTVAAETLTEHEPSFRVRVMTTSQAADLYLGELARQGRTQRTIASYRRTLHKLADTYPHHDVEELTASMLRVFLDGYQRNRKTGHGENRPATIAQAVTIVRCFFKWLHEEDLVTRDPAERIRRPKLAPAYENDNVVSVSSEDVKLMLLAAEGWQEKIAVSLAVYSGARRHALATIRRSDYDPFARTLRFREKGGKVIVKPVADPLADVLDAAIFAGVYNEYDGSYDGQPAASPDPRDTSAHGDTHSKDAADRMGSEAGKRRPRRTQAVSDPYLIPGNAVQRRPGDRDDRVVWRLIRRVAERAGVKTTVHALRAAFAVFYLETKGEDHLFSLQQLMGHSRVETTMVYLRRLDRRRSMETVRGLNWGVAADSGASPERESNSASRVDHLASTSHLDSPKSLESNPPTEKEGFEPSFSSKSHGNRLGFPSVQGFYEGPPE